MSKHPWQKRLREMVSRLHEVGDGPKVSVVGVGHELRGDDAAGLELARRLNRKISSVRLQAIEAGVAPENCCGQLFRFKPDLILFVDAALMAEKPGTICWLAWRDVDGRNVSTHTLPLPILANYLSEELDCPALLLGIQPIDISMGTALSPAVAGAVEEIARELSDLLSISEGEAMT